MNTEDTSDLVETAASGDRRAFGLLVTRYAAIVTGVAYSVCGDFTESEDVGQEAFIEAWKNLATLREPEKFVSWICTIARRRAIDAVRAAKRSKANSSIDNLPSELSDPTQHSPETSMSQQQDRELVWSMLENLPDAYREPMVLFYRCGQSTRDVAIALCENESTVRQRLKRAREMIRADVSETIRKTLCETAPKAAFVAVVLASLPSATYAAGATITTTAVAGKSTGAGSVAATSAVGGAVFGSLIGLMGSAFGTWMSWKNCEFASQQKFIIRQAWVFMTGLAIFVFLLAILIQARLHGLIDSGPIYGCLLVGLILVFQGVNLAWIWRGIRGYKQLGFQARETGEPMRESVLQQMTKLRQRTRVLRPDGSVGYEAFRWNAGGWGGTCLGSLAWMLPLGSVAFANGSILTGTIVGVCFLVGGTVAIGMWRARDRVDAYRAFQAWIGVSCVLTTFVLASVQYLADAKTQEIARWTPWAWLLLLIFPLVSIQFYWIRRSFEKDMLNRDEDEAKSCVPD